MNKLQDEHHLFIRKLFFLLGYLQIPITFMFYVQHPPPPPTHTHTHTFLKFVGILTKCVGKIS